MSLVDRCGDCLELMPNCTCDPNHLDWSAFDPPEKTLDQFNAEHPKILAEIRADLARSTAEWNARLAERELRAKLENELRFTMQMERAA